MKILPLAKIAAAKKRLIEKETNMPKIDEATATITHSYSSTATNALRFIERDGQRILQQYWHFDREVKGQYGEWKDVPLEMKP